MIWRFLLSLLSLMFLAAGPASAGCGWTLQTLSKIRGANSLSMESAQLLVTVSSAIAELQHIQMDHPDIDKMTISMTRPDQTERKINVRWTPEGSDIHVFEKKGHIYVYLKPQYKFPTIEDQQSEDAVAQAEELLPQKKWYRTGIPSRVKADLKNFLQYGYRLDDMLEVAVNRVLELIKTEDGLKKFNLAVVSQQQDSKRNTSFQVAPVIAEVIDRAPNKLRCKNSGNFVAVALTMLRDDLAAVSNDRKKIDQILNTALPAH